MDGRPKIDHISKEIILHGTIIEAGDYNPQAILGDLPTIRRNQIITIALDENYWQILQAKRVKIIIGKEETLKDKKNP